MGQAIQPAFKVNNIPVVFATDFNFIPYLGSAIQSLVENSSLKNNYDIVILYADINEQNIKQLASTSKNNVSIRFYDMSKLMDGYKDKWYTRCNWSKAVYYRFFIPKIFSRYEKVLYLDADIVILCDIAELYNIELGDNLIGAVPDIPRQYHSDSYKNFINNVIGIKCDQYFNNGILSLNIAKIERNNFLDTCIKTLSTLDNPAYLDQDVFNYIFKNRVKYFHNKYNFNWSLINSGEDLDKILPLETYRRYREASKCPKIIHYAGSYKPWKQPWLRYSGYFWKYACQTIFYKEIRDENTQNGVFTIQIIIGLIKIYTQKLLSYFRKYMKGDKMANQNNIKHSRTVKLFTFLPIYGWKEKGDKKTWKILGIPVFKRCRKANGNTTKYYFIGVPVIKVSKKMV